MGQEDEVRRLIQVERMWVETPCMADRMAVCTRTVHYSRLAVNKISVLPANAPWRPTLMY